MTMWWMNPILVMLVFTVIFAIILFCFVALKIWKGPPPIPDDPVSPRDYIRRKIADEMERSRQETELISGYTFPKYRNPINLNDFEYEIQNILTSHFGPQYPLYFHKDGKKYKLVFDETERMVQEVTD